MFYQVLVRVLTLLPNDTWFTPEEIAEQTGYKTEEITSVLDAMYKSLLGYQIKIVRRDGEIKEFQVNKLS